MKGRKIDYIIQVSEGKEERPTRPLLLHTKVLVMFPDQFCEHPQRGAEFHIAIESLVFDAVVLVLEFNVQPCIDLVRIVYEFQADLVVGQITQKLCVNPIQTGWMEGKRNGRRSRKSFVQALKVQFNLVTDAGSDKFLVLFVVELDGVIESFREYSGGVGSVSGGFRKKLSGTIQDCVTEFPKASFIFVDTFCNHNQHNKFAREHSCTKYMFPKFTVFNELIFAFLHGIHFPLTVKNQ